MARHYPSIENLYKNKCILEILKHVWALEKVHGTSAHIKISKGNVEYYSGENKNLFESLFNTEELIKKGTEIFGPRFIEMELMIHGEAYGGKCQGMSKTYGNEFRFIVFDIAINDRWCSVENMADIATKFGLEVVPHYKIPCTIEALDAERDKPSEVAVRRGITEPRKREGIVIRPLKELYLDESGTGRVIAKHRIKEMRETTTDRKVGANLEVLKQAETIADEWVTPMRLQHVLQNVAANKGWNIEALGMESMKDVINEMVRDVYKESNAVEEGQEKEGTEVIKSGEADKAIARKAGGLYRDYLMGRLN